jgi:RNase adapter protein RapZ
VETFQDEAEERQIVIYVNSFGFRHGVPSDSDLVFDVRFLPNPNYIPEFKHLTGRNPKVARYIRSFPQTVEFIERISELLVYLIPHYIREGKTYLTISFGCTGGQHRSVMIAAEIAKRLRKANFVIKEGHRDAKRN